MVLRVWDGVSGSKTEAIDCATARDGWPSSFHVLGREARRERKGEGGGLVSGADFLLLSLSLFLNISTIALRALAMASGLLRSGHLNQRCSLEPQPQHRMGSLVLAACWRACSAMLAHTVHCRIQRSTMSSGGTSGTETVGVLARTDERCSWSVG